MARIGVALSGGGHRASLFGLGVLMYLADAGRNRDVVTISSVSGGSLTNGFVAQSTNYAATDSEAFRKTVGPFAHQVGERGTLMTTMPSARRRFAVLVTAALTGLVWLAPGAWWVRLALFAVALGTWGAALVAPLFLTRLGKVYAVTLVVTLGTVVVTPWVAPLPTWMDFGFARFVLFVVASVVWISLVWSRRGEICARAFRDTLFSPDGRATLLRDVNSKIDHVLCATDLQGGEQVYFSGRFVYGYRFGKGHSGDLPLHAAVQASANLPFAFPARWLPTAGHRFQYQTEHSPPRKDRPQPFPSHMVLTDGGVYDNMADQWQQGFAERIKSWPALREHAEPDTLIVVNASEGLGWQPFKRSRLPAVGGLLTLLKVKDVLYDQTTAQRRNGLVGRFDRALLTGVGLAGALVHIPQTPFSVLERFENSLEWPDRAERAKAARQVLTETKQEWEAIAEEDAATPTVLSALGRRHSAQLLRHAYVLAMTNLHVILDFPLLKPPSASWFEGFVSGRVSEDDSATVQELPPDELAWVKLHPKLRMFASGSRELNATRAELSSALIVPTEAPAEGPRDGGGGDTGTPSKVDQPITREEPAEPHAHVFIGLVEDLAGPKKVHPGYSGRRGDLVAATIPVSEVESVAARPEVRSVEPGEPLSAPMPQVSAATRDPPTSALRSIEGSERHRMGQGVLIGIIDVGGFDFAHPDFLDEGKTRWTRIWDQGGDARPPPERPGSGGFAYGAEFTKKHLDRAIEEGPRLRLPPQELERQSQMMEGSHGTHVASIAAGNMGVCPKAFLAGVVVSLPGEEQDRRKTFSDSTRIAHAVDYLIRVAEELRVEHKLDHVPVSINVSLGTNGHAHDGTSAASRWIDSALSLPGRSVCVAAGNAGQTVPEFEGDPGWVMGRVHSMNKLGETGSVADLEWVVVGNGVADLSENEMEIWYAAQDRFAVSVKPPGGDWVGPVEQGQFIESHTFPDGTALSVYNERYNPANGSNYLALYLSPLPSPGRPGGVTAGTWTVRLHGKDVRDGRFHAWIERDDPRRLGRVGPKEMWNFPSFFSAESFQEESTVNSLACGRYLLSVANYDETSGRINVSSSKGPTRDARYKPDVAAPGTNIVAANGFSPDQEWMAMTGTSMASPFLTGVAGLMLATEPALTAAQIAGIVQRTALPPPDGNFGWLRDAGFGRVDPEACVVEAATVNERRGFNP